MTTKKCSRCGIVKEAKDFFNDSRRKDRLTAWCRACWREHSAERREKMGPKGRKDRKLKYLYGMSYNEYSAMLKAQNNVCAICKGKETVTNNKSGKLQKLCVDHDHVTGKVRALLCTSCNKGLGMFLDNPDRVLAAYEYIRSHTMEVPNDGSESDGTTTPPGKDIPGGTGSSRTPKAAK